MAVSSRIVKNKRDSNGVLTGREGTVYDVNIKYHAPEGYKTYSKKGFPTRKDAQQHEAEMRVRFSNPNHMPAVTAQGKMTVKEYLEEWVEAHGKANLRPSTFDSYKGYIRNHIVPNIGHLRLNQLTPAALDKLFQLMFEKGLSQSSVRYAQRILSVSLEAARKYRYIDTNPARDIITKFGKQGKTPDPYTIEQMQQLLGNITGTEWEMLVMLGGMYGLRLSEILGLRWKNVNLAKGVFSVVEQLPYGLPSNTLMLNADSDILAPRKEDGKQKRGETAPRVLPITKQAKPYFERQLELQARQKLLAVTYYDNDLVVAKPNGAPYRRDSISNKWGQYIRRLEMPYIRFHDTRHAAATNMHQLTGDFYTVGEILGHTLKGVGLTLGISSNLDSTTARYVDVRMERKTEVLSIYHKALHQKSGENSGDAT